MKKILEFWKSNEQWLLFLSLIVYLNGFWIFFMEEMQNKDWVVGLWLVQFFGLASMYSIRSNKMKWKLPKDIKDTH
jgi:hypothetical protein